MKSNFARCCCWLLIGLMAQVVPTWAAGPGPAHCPDGACAPNQEGYGYYPTRWRSWPLVSQDRASRAETVPVIPTPPVDLPAVEDEAERLAPLQGPQPQQGGMLGEYPDPAERAPPAPGPGLGPPGLGPQPPARGQGERRGPEVPLPPLDDDPIRLPLNDRQLEGPHLVLGDAAEAAQLAAADGPVLAAPHALDGGANAAAPDDDPSSRLRPGLRSVMVHRDQRWTAGMAPAGLRPATNEPNRLPLAPTAPRELRRPGPAAPALAADASDEADAVQRAMLDVHQADPAPAESGNPLRRVRPVISEPQAPAGSGVVQTSATQALPSSNPLRSR